MSQKDNITKHACDKEFWALKACRRQAVSFLVDWPGSLFFLCLISFDTMLDFKPQTQLLSQQVSQVIKYLDKQLYWLFLTFSLVKPSEQG